MPTPRGRSRVVAPSRPGSERTRRFQSAPITSGWIGNRAEARLRIRAGATSRPPVGRLAVGGAVIYLNDTNTPTLNSVYSMGDPAALCLAVHPNNCV